MKISSTRSMLKPPMVSWPGIGVRHIPMILPNSGKLNLSREFAEEDYETCGERIHGTLLFRTRWHLSLWPGKKGGTLSVDKQETLSTNRVRGACFCCQTRNSVHELMPRLQQMHEILLCRLTQCMCPLLIQAKRKPAGIDLGTCCLKPGKVCGCTVSHRLNGTTSCSGSRAAPEECGNCLP